MAYKIIALNIEEFNDINKKINSLPKSVLKNIQTAEKQISYICLTMEKCYGESISCNVPSKNINAINIEPELVVAYTDVFRFVFIKTNNQQVSINFH